MNNNKTVYRGTSLAITLTIIFVILKLTHVIDWNWVWVLAPFWISIASACLIVIVFAIIFMILPKIKIKR